MIETFDIRKKQNQKLWSWCCHVLKYNQVLTVSCILPPSQILEEPRSYKMNGELTEEEGGH